MKRFITLSVVCCLVWLKGWGCPLSYTPTTYHLFNVLPHLTDRYASPTFEFDLNRTTLVFWGEYAGKENAEEIYRLQEEGADNYIYQQASKRKDTEMVAYLDFLKTYYGGLSTEAWSYPTKEELEKRQQERAALMGKVVAYPAKHYKGSFLHLAMRLAFGMGDYERVINLWERRGKIKQKGYETVCENLYAGALWRNGRVDEALAIFVEQEDLLSLSLLQYVLPLSVSELRSLVKRSPNSQALNYLVQTFVNESNIFLPGDWENEELEAKDLDSVKRVRTSEIDAFVKLTDEVLADGRVRNPALWQSAAAMLLYQRGAYKEAAERGALAYGYGGNKYIKQNARIVRLLTSTAVAEDTKAYRDFLLRELNWIDSQSNYVYSTTQYDYEPLERENMFVRTRTHLVHNELTQLFERWGMLYYPLYLLFYNEKVQVFDWAPIYNSHITEALDTMSLDAFKEIIAKKSKCGKDSLENYLKSYVDLDYLNDYLGTRLLAEGRFEEAIPYLEKVPLSFLEKQRIAVYAKNRSYKKGPWMGWQNSGEVYGQREAVELTTNQKLDFCRDVLRLNNALSSATGVRRDSIAYELATYLYQGYDQCWYLREYSSGGEDSWIYAEKVKDTAFVNYKKFAGGSLSLLKQVAKSKDRNLKMKALFALAYVEPDENLFNCYVSGAEGYDGEVVRADIWNTYFGQINAMVGKKQQLPSYVSNCAVYRNVMKQR